MQGGKMVKSVRSTSDNPGLLLPFHHLAGATTYDHHGMEGVTEILVAAAQNAHTKKVTKSKPQS
jgi:hypothetical protein